MPGNMEKPWGILSKHNLLICSNTNACDWHFRVVEGGTKFKFWLWNYYCNCLHSLLQSLQEDTVFVHQNVTVPQVHHSKSSYHGSFITSKLRNLYSIIKFLNMQTDHQKTNCTVLHFYVDHISFLSWIRTYCKHADRVWICVL